MYHNETVQILTGKLPLSILLVLGRPSMTLVSSWTGCCFLGSLFFFVETNICPGGLWPLVGPIAECCCRCDCMDEDERRDEVFEDGRFCRPDFADFADFLD